MDESYKQLRSITDKLQDTEERLMFAMQSMEFGIWDWYIQDNRLIWDSQMLNIFDMTESEFKGNIEILEDRVHPADISEVKKVIREAVDFTGKFHCTYRIKCKGSSLYKKVSARGKVIYSNSGKPYRMVGVTWVDVDCK